MRPSLSIAVIAFGFAGAASAWLLTPLTARHDLERNRWCNATDDAHPFYWHLCFALGLRDALSEEFDRQRS
jgi:hypothetical protein